MLSKLISEVGIYKINQKVRIQENNNSTEKAIKKTRKKENNSTKKKKKKSFFFTTFLSSSCFLSFCLVFLFSYFPVFFYKFPPL